VLVTVLLASVRWANVVPPPRAWLGMFALTAIVMLAATPICWFHYFLWTLPAALFLIERRRLIVGVAIVSVVGAASPAARGLGVHMLLALVLFVAVAVDLRREATRARAHGGTDADRSDAAPRDDAHGMAQLSS
jgi:alpha-1,2-mannosyltransferase